ncbi:hypothetical protein [Kordia sp.]|uniref:hypothetical protein n=1 Tax=Kordia sp. TaxID=1965332 RepID=UPI0025BE27FE|nr:hypothetical protein [Kordia sp.]MCH2193754.1 hypothetical protein [Kordia sp.]
MKKLVFKKIPLNKRTISSLDANQIGGGKVITTTCVSCDFVGSDDPTDPNAVCLDEPKKEEKN